MEVKDRDECENQNLGPTQSCAPEQSPGGRLSLSLNRLGLWKVKHLKSRLRNRVRKRHSCLSHARPSTSQVVTALGKSAASCSRPIKGNETRLSLWGQVRSDRASLVWTLQHEWTWPRGRNWASAGAEGSTWVKVLKGRREWTWEAWGQPVLCAGGRWERPAEMGHTDFTLCPGSRVCVTQVSWVLKASCKCRGD